jgi:hypothetical protein
MKPLSTALCTVAVLLLISSQRPMQAQTTTTATAAATGAAGPLGYDVNEEVTLTGTVSSVLTKAAPGMIVGSHLLLATASGEVDVSLGRFGLQGEGAVSVAAGQQIEATGVMKRIRGKSFFLVRSIKVGSEVYVVRNKHGFPVSPQARRRAVEKTVGKGESL